jgi:hypothetical protein
MSELLAYLSTPPVPEHFELAWQGFDYKTVQEPSKDFDWMYIKVGSGDKLDVFPALIDCHG